MHVPVALPTHDGAVDEDGEEDDEGHVGQVGDALGERPGNDGRRDDGELCCVNVVCTCA